MPLFLLSDLPIARHWAGEPEKLPGRGATVQDLFRICFESVVGLVLQVEKEAGPAVAQEVAPDPAQGELLLPGLEE